MKSQDLQTLAEQGLKREQSQPELGNVLQHRVFFEFDEKSRLPTSQLKLSQLCEVIRTALNARLNDQCSRVIVQNNLDLDGMSVDEFDSQIPFQVEFENGTFKSPKKSNPITVGSIVIRSNSMSVIVNGGSSDAEEVVAGVYNAVMDTAGYSTKFSESNIHAKAHSCSTVASMNLGIEKLFSEQVNSAIKKTISSNEDRFKTVGAMRVDVTDKDLKQYILVPKVRAIEFSLTRFDTASGHSEDCFIRIAPRTTSDVNAGDYVVISEYPEDIHNELVSALKEALPID